MTIGQRIKEVRKSAGLTQRELAEKSGTATGTIQQYELGKRQPRIEQLQAIASALGVTTNYFLTGEKKEVRPQLSPLQQFCMESGAQRFIYLKGQGVAIDLEECKDLILLQAAAYQTSKDLAAVQTSVTRTLNWLDELRKELAQ